MEILADAGSSAGELTQQPFSPLLTCSPATLEAEKGQISSWAPLQLGVLYDPVLASEM